MTIKYTVIYHSNCLDGFGAAWAARRYFQVNGKREDVEFIPGVYQTTLPDVTGKFVYVVDFSYKREDMKKLASQAKQITVIDHHASAIKDLEDLDKEVVNLNLHFGKDNSGAVLTWRHFFPNNECPMLLKHIEDRDLWAWKLEGTKEITTGLFAKGFNFEGWSELIETGENGIAHLYAIGSVLNEKFDADLARIIKSSTHRLVIDGYSVPAINAPGMFASEGGNILSQGEPFAAVYQILDGKLSFSLRSQGNEAQALDVSVIAAKFGGGGHKNAAGFSIPFTLGEIKL